MYKNIFGWDDEVAGWSIDQTLSGWVSSINLNLIFDVCNIQAITNNVSSNWWLRYHTSKDIMIGEGISGNRCSYYIIAKSSTADELASKYICKADKPMSGGQEVGKAAKN